MKTLSLNLAMLLVGSAAAAQSSSGIPSNLNFEQVNPQTHKPTGWWAGSQGGYQAVADSVTRYEGRYSLRIKSNGEDRPEKAFGVATQRIPVTFRGKTLKLTAFAKTENVQNGFAGLWLRIDGAQGALDFDNMNKRPIQGSTGWQQYTITLPLSDDAQAIFFGGLMPATGTLWLDKFELTVDDKPISQAPPKAVAHFKAEQDTAFNRGSGIALGTLTKQQIDNLAVLGRVWGFIKYYHPAVARGDYNLDAELLRVLPKVLSSKGQVERSQLLSTWLTSLGPIPACATCHEPVPDSIRLRADLAWLTDKKQVSSALSKQLEYLCQNRNQSAHYYVASAPNVGNPVFNHEESYASLETPDAGLRLVALFRYWNMIAYFFPYRYAIGEDWQRVLPEFIPQFAAANTAEQYQLAALRLAARIHDTHASLSGKALANYWGKYYAPAQVRFVENQAVVTDYYDATLGAASGLQKGDVVVQVDGVKVADLIKARQPLTPASNEPTQLRNIAQGLLRGTTEKVALVVRRDGRELPLTVTRYPAGQLNLAVNYGTPDPKAPAWHLLPGNIGYLALGTIQQAQLPQIMASAKDTKGLVIDMRNYPSEFVVFALSQYLLSEPKAFVTFSEPVVSYPGMFARTPTLTLPASKGTPYAGKVVLLLNEVSQSQAEYTAMALRTAPRATVIGSTTAGADGNVSSITLPGGVKTYISGIGIYYPDGRETQRVGIVPDIEVKPTIKGIKEGRDEVLEKAVQLIEQG